MKNILLVDDALFMRYALRLMLEPMGHNIVGEASNGRDAVNLFKRVKPDLVLMDITMPELDGLGALKEIMLIDATAKVIMISAMGRELIIREAILLGAKGFIVKPFVEKTVLKVLEKM
ncbi:MAG TPA: response regulator [Clostridiales bacterium]|nr:MAG: histidine kinase [Clostridiales bacterium GWD2_32_59]HAN09616.1 response regulator [Clostridiales bacterium]